MPKTPELFLPGIPNTKAMETVHLRALCPHVPEPISLNSLNRSLFEFTHDISGQHLTDFMLHYKKDGLPSDSYTFQLKPVLGSCDRIVETEGWGSFYMDSPRGFALGIREPAASRTLWIATTGISVGQELNFYDPVDRQSLKDKMDFPYPFPIITQLQGPGKVDTYLGDALKREQANRALGKYRWEKALIGIVLEWAQTQGIPAVYLLPANKNHWLLPEREESLHIRYNVSAERMGFRMQPNGLYGISLLPLLDTSPYRYDNSVEEIIVPTESSSPLNIDLQQLSFNSF
jgi:hypothetical protein